MIHEIGNVGYVNPDDCLVTFARQGQRVIYVSGENRVNSNEFFVSKIFNRGRQRFTCSFASSLGFGENLQDPSARRLTFRLRPDAQFDEHWNGSSLRHTCLGKISLPSSGNPVSAILSHAPIME
jgi:hypothetical protein